VVVTLRPTSSILAEGPAYFRKQAEKKSRLLKVQHPDSEELSSGSIEQGGMRGIAVRWVEDGMQYYHCHLFGEDVEFEVISVYVEAADPAVKAAVDDCVQSFRSAPVSTAPSSEPPAPTLAPTPEAPASNDSIVPDIAVKLMETSKSVANAGPDAFLTGPKRKRLDTLISFTRKSSVFAELLPGGSNEGASLGNAAHRHAEDLLVVLQALKRGQMPSQEAVNAWSKSYDSLAKAYSAYQKQ
jgi:hypothetical protein